MTTLNTLNRINVSLPVISANGNARPAHSDLTARLDARVVAGSYGRSRTVYTVTLETGAGLAVYRSRCHVTGAAAGARWLAAVTAALAAGANPATSAKWVAVARPQRGIDRELARLADAE